MKKTEIQQELKRYEQALKRRNLSSSTISGYSASIRRFYERGFKLSFDDYCRYKELLAQRLKPSSVCLEVHALNSYAEFRRCRFRLKPVKIHSQDFVEAQLTRLQYEKLLDCLYNDGNLRWWASIKVMACTGVRISEFLQIKLEDLKVGYVDVCGKGDKYRRIWFPSKLRKEVLSVYHEEGLLLPHTDGVVRKRLHVFAKRYNIDKRVLHPHEFRAFYARNVYEKCKDLKFLQNLLGHSDIKTTVRYLRKTSKGISRRISKIVTW